MPLSSLAVHRPVTTLMFYTGVVMLGAVALTNLTVDFLPSIDVPALTVQTVYPGTSPEEVEHAVTAPVESVLGTIAGVKRIRSVSSEGLSVVSVTFAWGTKMDRAFLDVREKLDAVRTGLPRDAGRPAILRVDPSIEPILTLAVSSDLRKTDDPASLAALKETARALVKRRIEQVEGVAQVTVLGGAEREIRVDLDLPTLKALGVDIGQVGTALASANVDLPGGTIRHGPFRYALRTLGALTTTDEIRNVIIRHGGTGRAIRVADCATVEDGYAERTGLTRYNGREVITLQVRKEAGANTVGVASAVHQVLAQLRVEDPGLELNVVTDQAGFISRSIDDVQQAIIMGGLLAVLVLFAFLRKPRYPVIIGLTIPVSVLATIAVMYFLGINLNIISLTGLALGIGMLGDNAIVLIENVTRLREEGMPLQEATLAGAREIGTAVSASTLTNVAVFLPVVFVEGVAARLFVDMGVTMTISLLVSLLVAVTLVPMLVSRETAHAGPGGRAGRGMVASLARGRRKGLRDTPRWHTITLVEMRNSLRMGMYGLIDRMDARVRAAIEVYLHWGMEHRWTVVAWTTGVAAATALIACTIPSESAPDIDQSRFVIHLRMERGTTLEGLGTVSLALEDALLLLPGVAGVYARVGLTDERSFWQADDATRESVELDVQVAGPGLTPSLMDSARIRLARLAAVTHGVEYAVKPRGTSFERILRPEADDIRTMVLGKDPAVVERLAAGYAALIRQIPGLVDLRVSMQEGTPEYRLAIDRDAVARNGLTVHAVAEQLSRLARGEEATALTDVDRRIAVHVQPSERVRNDLDALLGSDIAGTGARLPLRSLVSCTRTRGESEIWREDQQRAQMLVANTGGRAVGSVVADMEVALREIRLPPGYEIRIGGEHEEISETFRSLVIVILLSLFLVFMILAAEYESLLYPAVILLTSPLAAVGAICSMAITGQHYNVMSLVGLVIMIGAVDNDAVIVVDVIIALRREGLATRDAILRGMRQRFRPILMTTATTLLGIIPLVFEFGTGSELVRALSIPLVGGLISSTVATVAVIPIGMCFVEKGGRRPHRKHTREAGVDET